MRGPRAIAGLLAAAWLGVQAGCAEEPMLAGPAVLDSARILAIRAEPPALVPPGTVTLTTFGYDPAYRVPSIHWYVGVPAGNLIDALPATMADPASVGAPWTYLGPGTTVTVPVPPVPAAALPESFLFDTVEVPVVVSMRWGATERLGFLQVRAIVPELVERNLRHELGRPPAATEVAEAIARRRNRNPRIRGWNYAAVGTDGAYPENAKSDLLVRRVLPSMPLDAAVLSDPALALRLTPRLVDPDVVDRPELLPGQPGYNALDGILSRTVPEGYPLSLTHGDWRPEPSRDQPLDGLVVGRYVLIDGQGGVDWAGLEWDAGAPPRRAHRGAAGSVLLGEGARQLWLRADAARLDAAAALRDAPGSVSATIRPYANPVAPHALTAEVADLAAAPATAPATRWLDRLGDDPAAAAALTGTPVVLYGRILRLWRPGE